MPIVKEDHLADLQRTLDLAEQDGYQQMMKAQSIVAESKAPSWSIGGVLKKFFSLMIGISLVSVIAFPKNVSYLPDTIESMDRV